MGEEKDGSIFLTVHIKLNVIVMIRVTIMMASLPILTFYIQSLMPYIVHICTHSFTR